MYEYSYSKEDFRREYKTLQSHGIKDADAYNEVYNPREESNYPDEDRR